MGNLGSRLPSVGEWLISSLSGEMPGKTEEGAVPPALLHDCFAGGPDRRRSALAPSGLPISPAREESSQSPGVALDDGGRGNSMAGSVAARAAGR